MCDHILLTKNIMLIRFNFELVINDGIRDPIELW